VLLYPCWLKYLPQYHHECPQSMSFPQHQGCNFTPTENKLNYIFNYANVYILDCKLEDISVWTERQQTSPEFSLPLISILMLIHLLYVSLELTKQQSTSLPIQGAHSKPGRNRNLSLLENFAVRYKPTRCDKMLVYWLNMFRALVCPSSGVH
jgi:hypothetical protein